MCPCGLNNCVRHLHKTKTIWPLEGINSQDYLTIRGRTMMVTMMRHWRACAVERIDKLLHKCTVLFSLALDTTTFASTQAEGKAGWTGLEVKSTVHPLLLHKCTMLFSSALATPINLAMPHSTPIYCRTKATPIFSRHGFASSHNPSRQYFLLIR
jgi:hypothetical protein